MGIMQNVARGLGVVEFSKGTGRPRALGMSTTSNEISRPPLTYDLLYAYLYNSWAYGAVKAIANAIASVPLIVVEKKDERGRFRTLRDFVKEDMRWGVDSWEETMKAYQQAEGTQIQADHEVLALLADPYPEAQITGYDLLEAAVTTLELDGNAYIEKVWDKGKEGIPDRLWPKVDPRKVVVVPGEERLVAGYLFRGPDGFKLFKWDEMAHLMYYNPLNPFYGTAAARVLRTQLISETKAIDWNRLFFEMDATPGGLLSTKERLGPDDVRMMRSVWNDRYQGPGRAHEIAVLGQGASFQPISPTHKDMGFQDLRSFTKKEVQATYGVPSVVLGDYEDANRASAMTMARLFYLNTVLPRLAKIEGYLNFQLMGDYPNQRLMFNVAVIDALQEDILVRSRASRNFKFWTPNEHREFHGLPRAKGAGMDTVYLENDKQVPIGAVGGSDEGGVG